LLVINCNYTNDPWKHER